MNGIPNNLQHRLFPKNQSLTFNCGNDPPQQLIDALKIAEVAVNEAIQEGAESVRLRYLNIPDAERNPQGLVGRVHVVGYRKKAAVEEAPE